MMRRACLVLFAAFALVGFRHIERRPPMGLVAGYTFNHGDARDVSMNGHDGSIQSDATVSDATLNLDGVGDRMTIPDSDDFSPTDGAGNDQPITFCGWVYLDSSATNNQGFCGKLAATAHWEYFCLVTAGSGQGLRMTLYSGGTSAVNLNVVQTSRTMTSGVWYHIAYVYDGSEVDTGIRMYVNGSPVTASRSTTGSYLGITNGPGVLNVGGQDAWNTIAGKIDDFLIFDRALTATEIRQLYESGRTP